MGKFKRTNSGSFKKGHKTNVGRKRGPMPKWQRKLYSELAKKRKGIDANHWKGGRRYSRGYVLIYQPDHPFCIDNRYVLEHRLVMEKKFGRYLKPEESVHHINGIKDDNREENLQLMFKKSHDTLSFKTMWKNGNLSYNPNWPRNKSGQFKKRTK